MLPIMLDLSAGLVVLVGGGPAALRRLRLLQEAGANDISLFVPDKALADLEQASGVRLFRGLPDEATIASARILFVADAPEAAQLAATARRLGVLVNVEDVKALCDFYTPSVVRRGDLAISVSTHGASPGVARRIRQKIEQVFGAEWGEKLEEIACLRKEWQAQGQDMAGIARRTDEWIERNGLL